MIFRVHSALSYIVNSPSTIFASLRCLTDRNQTIVSENLSTSRSVEQTELAMQQARITRFDIESAGLFDINYQTKVKSSIGLLNKNHIIEDHTIGQIAGEYLPYLLPSRYAQSDRLRPFANDLFGEIEGKLNQVLTIEEWIWQKLFYTPGISSETHSAIDTLETRQGVCRDFAHLGIALCRALSIPARYVTVYAHQIDRPDFHAVFEVLISGRWILLDPTRIAPLNGFIRIATGRDASDAAVTTIFGNVYGNGIKVSVEPEKDENFAPLSRYDLEDQGLVISSK